MSKIHIRVTRHSAFYTPLIMTIAGGFLAREGLEADYSVQGVGADVIKGIEAGDVQVGQSAVRNAWTALEAGRRPEAVHFAQINERDGFFIAGREPDRTFTWDKLVGREVLVDHGAQPHVMFRYAAHRSGIDYRGLTVIDAGSPEQIDRAFREGRGDFVHMQGPAPQQLESDRLGYVVARVGDAIGPVAFSSLCARRDWLTTPQSLAFMKAYRAAREHVRSAPPDAIADAELSFFPEVARAVLTSTIDAYQQLGCWTADVRITREAYERALDVYAFSGAVKERHIYETAVMLPPDEPA